MMIVSTRSLGRLSGHPRSRARLSRWLAPGLLGLALTALGAAWAHAGPAVGLSATRIDFDPLPIGATSEAKLLTVTNTGDAPLTISDIRLNSGDFLLTAGSGPGTLPPGASRTLEVSYTPRNLFYRYGLLTVVTNAPNSPHTIGLISEEDSRPGPRAYLSPQFGNLGFQPVGNSGFTGVYFNNVGNAPLTIRSVTIVGPHAEDFRFEQGGEPGIVRPGTYRMIRAEFRPSVRGPRYARFVIESDAPGSPHTFAMFSTNSSAPPPVISPGSLSFGEQPSGTSSAVQTVTIENTGVAPLYLHSVTVGGSRAEQYALISGGEPGYLAPGQNRAVRVAFAPWMDGGGYRDDETEASLFIAHDAIHGDQSPVVVRLTGTRIVPEASFSPYHLSFGNQRVRTSSDAQTITLSNTGTAPLAIVGLRLEGPEASDFTLLSPECVGQTLAPGGSCPIRFRFTPGAMGARAATLRIETNLWRSQVTAELSGQGVAPVLRANPTRLDFGSQPLGTASGPQTMLVQNTGNAPLDIAGITLSGDAAGDFAIVVDGLTGARLMPGEMATLSVRFTPTAPGNRTAQLLFRSNAGNTVEPVGLTGSGAAPAAPTLTLTPHSLSFGPEPLGLSGTLAVLLHNVGQAPVSIGTISIHGANAEEFTLPLGGCSNSTLAPGAICLLNVRFSPTATGSRSALLMIPTDAVGSPHVVSLTGTGTAPLLRLSADSLTFDIPATGQTSASETVTITNHGDAPLTIEGLSLAGAQASSFQIVSDSGEESLDPGATRTVKVAFRPAGTAGTSRSARIAAASYSATLQIRHNDTRPSSPRQVQLIAVAPTPTAPTAPASLRAVSTTPTQVNLTWSDTSANETEFVLMRKRGSGLYTRLAVLPANTTSYTDAAASANTGYSYILKAANTIDASPWSNEAAVTTPRLLPPAAPMPLQATAISPTQVTLTWTDRSHEREFVLLRKTGSGVYARVAVLPANATSFTDSNVAPNTTYQYIMRAVNEAGVSPWTNEPSVTTPDPRPAKPTNLRAVAVAATQVNLTWEDRSSNETQFVLLRKIGTGVYQRIAVVAPNTTSYTDTTVRSGVSYSYIMRAVNGAGVSGWSNEPSVTPR